MFPETRPCWRSSRRAKGVYAQAIVAEVGTSELLQWEVRDETAPVGGGSLPGAELPTAVIGVTHSELSVDELAKRLRLGTIRLLGRIQRDSVLVDLRSVLPEDDSKIALALRLAAGTG